MFVKELLLLFDEEFDVEFNTVLLSLLKLEDDDETPADPPLLVMELEEMKVPFFFKGLISGLLALRLFY